MPTLDDWDRLEPLEGHRIELKDGRYRTAAPVSVGHQRTVGGLRDLLVDALEPLGWDVLGAVGVRVRPGLGYIPDVIVCEPVDDDAVSVSAGTVQLAVEVVSPSTRKIDRFEKPIGYAAAGIPAYWRVEVVKHRPPTMYCYGLDDGTYVETATVETGNPQQITLPLGVTVTLDVDELARLPRRG